MITHLEEISMNAWQALQTFLLDGWVLRLANGYTRRANSINPIYASTDNVEKKIRDSEQFYRRNHLPVIFKMTSAVHPENLDALLDKHGYTIDARTSVQMMEIGEFHSASEVKLDAVLSDEWLGAFCRMSGTQETHQATLRQILQNIQLDKRFASITQADKIVACGLAVQQGDYIGFYDIVTDRSFRNQGLSKRLMHSLLAWGKHNGARHAYLQVMLNNPPALHLYAQLGFKEVYPYWYRVKQ